MVQIRTTAGRKNLDDGRSDVDLEFDVEKGAMTDCGEHISQGRDPAIEQGVGGHRVDPLRATLDTSERLVMDHNGDAVGGGTDVEFNATAARYVERRLECRDRVLGSSAPIASMGDPTWQNRRQRSSPRSGGPGTRVAEIPKWSLG